MKQLYSVRNLSRVTLLAATCSLGMAAHAQSYIQSTCDYAPLATEGTVLCLGDDAVSGAVPLGFTFNFYETPFTECYVSSNGYLSFTAGLGSACCTGQVLPNATYTNSIFFGQEDLDPNSCVDGDITYYTTGAPGSQIFVMSFVDVPHYPGPEGTFPVTVQVQLYEGTDEIRIVTTEWNSDGGLATMGLNHNGTEADIVTGRNSQVWDAFEECISFLPDGLPDEGCTDPTAINYDPGAEIDNGSCFYGYEYTTCDYAPMPTEGTVVCLFDDDLSDPISIGFDFPFYGVDHNTAYISSNGFVTFQNGLPSGCCTGQVLPNATYLNTVFLGQEDLDPNNCVDGEINYYTTGAPGDQVFVVNFVGVPHYPGPAGTFNTTMQLQCYEATGEVRIVVTEWNSDGGAATMGLNYNGTVADWVPGRNSEVWDAFEECHSWMPIGLEDICPVPTGLFVDGITENDAVLHWDSVPGADQYRVTLQNTVTGLTRTKGYYTNMVEITDKLQPLTTYAFRVKTVCYDDLGEISDPSEWYFFTTLGRLGQTEANVTMFPNPNAGTFTLQLNGMDDTDITMQVFDATGNLLISRVITTAGAQYTETVSLDVPSGMYFVNLNNATTQLTYPVVIQK